MASLIAAIVMTLSVLMDVPPLQAFSSVIFHTCGTLHSPSISAELHVSLVLVLELIMRLWLFNLGLCIIIY